MHLPRTKSRPWIGMSWCLVLLACRTGRVCGGFSSAPGTRAWKDHSTRLFSAPSPQPKHQASDRYSSTTVSESQVQNHMEELYEEEELESAQEENNPNTEATSTIPRNTFLNELNRYPALILNADYQPMSYLPLSVSHWQEAIKLIFSGKVAVVDVYEGVTIRAANLEVPLPSVIALNDYVPQCSHKPAFTRRNVFLRDEYTCQYCNNMFHAKDLSIDHVVPRCMGGRLSWDNAVTSCMSCNGRKGNKLVSDLKALGMKLHSKPRAPTRHELALKAGKMLPRKVHPTWQPFLGTLFDNDDDDGNTARPDLVEALGINFHGEALHNKLQDPKPRKVISKNSKKKTKKQQQQQKDLQDSMRLIR